VAAADKRKRQKMKQAENKWRESEKRKPAKYVKLKLWRRRIEINRISWRNDHNESAAGVKMAGAHESGWLAAWREASAALAYQLA